MTVPVRVDAWSDIVCPWCYIGKRRLESAIRRFEPAGAVGAVEMHWHSFQLDPSHPPGQRRPLHDHMTEHHGLPLAQVRAMTGQVTELAAAEGLSYALDRAVAVNTLDAHRLTQLAASYGLGSEMHERLMRAYTSEAEVVDDHETLARLAAEVGVDAEEARKALSTDAYRAEVIADIDQARQLGITGVPFFVLNQKYAVSGAQPADTFLSALRTAAAG